MYEVVHLLSGLRYGGKEQVAIRLARRGIASGQHHRLLLSDTPFRSTREDIDPGGVPWTFVPRPRRFVPTYAIAIARQLRRDRLTIVHAHGPTAIIYAALTRLAWPLATTRSLRVVGTVHISLDDLTMRARHALRIASRGCAQLCAVSESLANHLRTALPGAALQVVANGIDTEAFVPNAPCARRRFRERHGVPSDALVFGTLGRLDGVKRQSDLIDAAAVIARSHPSVRVLIGGDGPLRSALERQASGIPGLSLIGAVDDPVAFHAGVDVFVLPSSYEAAPLVLLEAMASGRPVVATRVGGIPEIVGDDRAALLVEAANVDALASAMERLATDPDLRARLGRTARARALQRSEEITWTRYREIYDRIALNRDT